MKAAAAAFRPHPFKGIDRFYDVGGILKDPWALATTVDGLATRLSAAFPGATAIGAIDARGFLFATPVAMTLGLPVVMVRKLGKMPDQGPPSTAYAIEYGERDGVAVQRHAVGPGSRVVLVDDLVATGGTMTAAIEAVENMGGEVVGCASLVEIDGCAEARAKVLPDGRVPRVALFTEAELLEAQSAPKIADTADGATDGG